MAYQHDAMRWRYLGEAGRYRHFIILLRDIAGLRRRHDDAGHSSANHVDALKMQRADIKCQYDRKISRDVAQLS